jgi:hypothetical protein
MLTLGVTTEFSLPKLLSGTICAEVGNILITEYSVARATEVGRIVGRQENF